MNCIIVEDQLPAQRILQKFISEDNRLILVGVFTNTYDAKLFLNQKNVDLIFLDVHLPKQSGVDFLKTVENLPQVIITSAFDEYAIAGFELNVVDYLLKPFAQSRFETAVNKAIKNKSNEQEIFIKSGYEVLKINVNEIISIMAEANYTEIKLNQKRILSSETLKYWEDTLLHHGLIRIHKSHLINKRHINTVKSTEIIMRDGSHLSVGRVYKESFKKSFQV